MRPFLVAVVREGVEAEIVPGDLIILREGDKVPADGRVVQGSRRKRAAALRFSAAEEIRQTGPPVQPPGAGGHRHRLALAALIIYTPIGNAIFGCAPLGINVWLLLIPFALLLAADETRKYVVRRGSHATEGP